MDLYQALIGMATMNQSVHSITGLLEQVPCETSFRYYLKKLTTMDELERKNTAIPTSPLGPVLKTRDAYQFAIDYTNDPYYGTTSGENDTYIVRSKRKQSTNEFYSYVTLYVTT